jgi:NAD(P)-dependent dehydrogenase (short-subunit alcohol dehydrogenase family)
LAINCFLPLKLMSQLISLGSQKKSSNFTVINISSGEGELGYLHTSIAAEINGIQSIPELVAYIDGKLLELADDQTVELAYGPTPCYSVSKAILNKITQLFIHVNEIPSSHWRSIACCPGNFASPMSTPEELLTAIDVNQAAKEIVQIAINFDQFSSGKFYRHLQEINW